MDRIAELRAMADHFRGPVAQAAKDLIAAYFGDRTKVLASIPARPDVDADLVLTAALAQAPTLAADLADALAEVERLRAALTDDGRPCNTDVFLAAAMQQFDDKWDFYEAVKDWVEGDWDGALTGMDRAALAPASGAGGGEAG